MRRSALGADHRMQDRLEARACAAGRRTPCRASRRGPCAPSAAMKASPKTCADVRHGGAARGGELARDHVGVDHAWRRGGSNSSAAGALAAADAAGEADRRSAMRSQPVQVPAQRSARPRTARSAAAWRGRARRECGRRRPICRAQRASARCRRPRRRPTTAGSRRGSIFQPSHAPIAASSLKSP